MTDDVVVGPVRVPRNDARDQAETGSLSLHFRTTDGEPVLVKVRRPGPGPDVQTDVWIQAPDGTLVAEGTAGAGSPLTPSALHARDLRPVDPSTLRILREVRVGEPLDGGSVRLGGTVQRRRPEGGIVTEPLDWYRESPWGGAVATPATVVDLLYRAPVQALAARIGEAVGMWWAIEIRHLHGPVLLDRTYRVTSEVVALSDSPKTEVLWYDSTAWLDGVAVASLRIMTRFVKASSPLYTS